MSTPDLKKRVYIIRMYHFSSKSSLGLLIQGLILKVFIYCNTHPKWGKIGHKKGHRMVLARPWFAKYHVFYSHQIGGSTVPGCEIECPEDNSSCSVFWTSILYATGYCRIEGIQRIFDNRNTIHICPPKHNLEYSNSIK